ncbi:hypothetical protein SEA_PHRAPPUCCINO_90 [Mycobacterium phage Phrappuccino]|uniref:Uncharacterized protein n=1 Tax=Mycobacterium phage Phrappuccino TaxID=2591223 RepID=A0A514DDS7_9CAUD|nr:hypothetical protein KHQ87_gp090 [Mycobacterium phage Phrappuccino]QDH91765.1 hypothetical protein SEA_PHRAPPUCCINO_90 [Mycobacterium phage Phrappuccino]QIQ63207.1 hypothetical protein SEA_SETTECANDELA_90 [Mycobacterium phage Settecandela]
MTKPINKEAPMPNTTTKRIDEIVGDIAKANGWKRNTTVLESDETIIETYERGGQAVRVEYQWSGSLNDTGWKICEIAHRAEDAIYRQCVGFDGATGHSMLGLVVLWLASEGRE